MKKDDKVKDIVDCVLPIGALGGITSLFSSQIYVGGTSIATMCSSFSIPMVGIGVLGATSVYSAYKILTKQSRELKEERNNWFKFWESINISTNKEDKKSFPILFDKQETNYGALYKFIPNLGLSSAMIESKDICIKEYLNARDIKVFIKDNILFLQSFTVSLPHFVPYNIKSKNHKDLILYLGRDNLGETLSLNLDKSPSLLIAGQTGSGKSVCTNTILTQLYCYYKEVDVYLIDVKRTEFGIYKNCKKTVKYTKDLEDAKTMIKELVEECDRRSDLFDEVGARKLSDYNSRVSKDKKLNKIVLVIDDSVRLMNDNETRKSLSELGFICRSSGLYVISNIQRPSSKLFSADFKASLTNTIGFKTTNGVNSRVICDDNKLKDLRGRGHGILFSESCNDGESEFQGFALEDYQIEKYLKEYDCYK